MEYGSTVDDTGLNAEYETPFSSFNSLPLIMEYVAVWPHYGVRSSVASYAIYSLYNRASLNRGFTKMSCERHVSKIALFA
jgi:hypothetical protein